MRRLLAARRLAVLAALLLMVPLAASAARARTLDAGLQQQLQALFSQYNQDITAGHLDAALALRSTAARAALEQQLKTPRDRQDYLTGARELVPERLELRHGSIDDATEKALLIAWGDKATASGQVRSELDIGFVRENGTWKLGDIVLGPGPADIKHCDPGYQPISAYDASHPVSLSGRIESVGAMPDHTLVVLLAGNTETCAFLPDGATLRQHGLDPAILQPYRIAAITGVANRTDPQKVMVNNITVHAEE